MLLLAIIGSSPMAYRIGKNAHEMGVNTICFSNAWHDYMEGYIDYFEEISIFEIDTIVDICKQKGVNGVIATTELTVAVAATIADRLGLLGIPVEVAPYITDKYRNRTCCRNLKLLKQPFCYRVSAESEIAGLNLNYPVIVKPTAQGGKRGITVVKKEKNIKEAYCYAKKASGDKPVLIEEFVGGNAEYSVESLSCDGQHYIVQVTQKISSGAPHCVELGHLQPASLTSVMREKVEEAVKEGLQAIGLDNSPCHTEVKIYKDEVYLIEFNPRFGGDHISYPLVDLSTGYEYMKGAIQIAMGCFNGIDYSTFKHYYAGVYFVTQQTAFLKPLFDVCEKYPWLVEKNLVSEELTTLEHNNSRGTNYMIYQTENAPLDINKSLNELN